MHPHKKAPTQRRSETTTAAAVVRNHRETDSHWLYMAIDPTVIVWRAKNRRQVFKWADTAWGAMQTLDAIGRDGLELLFIATRRAVLHPHSTLTLGIYLKHGNGLALFKRANPPGVWCRQNYAALSEQLGLCWLPTSKAPPKLRKAARRLLATSD